MTQPQRFWLIRQARNDCLYYNGASARTNWTIDLMAALRFATEAAAISHIVSSGKIDSPAHAVEVITPPDA